MTTETAARPTATGEDPDKLYPVPQDPSFDDKPYMMAKDLKALAREIMKGDTFFKGLRGRRLSYLWRRKGGNSDGMPVLFKSEPISQTDALAFVSNDAKHELPEAIVTLSADHLRDRIMHRQNVVEGADVVVGANYLQVEATMYRALRRLRVSDEGKVQSNPYEVTTFADEIERYGSWEVGNAGAIAASKDWQQAELLTA